MQYRAFASGLTNRTLIPIDENYFSACAQIIRKSPKKDYYESIYIYEEEHYKQWEKKKTLAGISNVVTDRLVFDFDSHNAIRDAQADANELISRLLSKGISIDAIRIFYSGNKGFHIEVHLNNFLDRKEFEKITDYLAKDLKTFDTKIRDEQRIFRFPLTLHPKTKRYKIPLTLTEISDWITDDFEREAAELKPELFDILKLWVPTDLPEELKNIPSQTDNAVAQIACTISDKPDLSKRPPHLTSAKYVLQEGFFEEGERNEACMILASTYKYLGYHEEITYNILKAVLRLRAQRLKKPDYDKEELWLQIIKTVYSPNWKGGIYSENENELLKKTIQRYNLHNEYKEKSSVSISEVSNKFLDFAKNIDKNRIQMGIADLDEKVLMTSGMLVGLLGAPSSGKSTLSFNFLEYQSKQNLHSFFVSADMTDSLVYARLLQRYCGMHLKQILDTIKQTEMVAWPKSLQTAWDLVQENYKNVGFSFQSGPTVDDIKKRLDEYEQRTGNAVRVLVIDYLEKIYCNQTDPTAATAYNVTKVADLCRDKDIATILLLQPQKLAGDPSEELLTYTKIKGSSRIQQDSRVVISVWRPGFNPDTLDNKEHNPDDRFLSMAIIKNNMGPTGRINLNWDGLTGKVSSMIPEDQAAFNRVVEENKKRKFLNKKPGGDLW